MKTYKTIIFVLSILLMLAGLSHIFPPEGIHFDIDLSFPSLQEVLATRPDEDELDDELTTEDLLEQDRRNASLSKDSAFAEFCHHSPIRISMPFVHVSVPDTIDDDEYQAMPDSTRTSCDSIIRLSESRWIAYRDSVTTERDMAYLDPLFESFDSAQQRHVRILHYGDSQLEGDRITSLVREFLQSRFGGGGPGILPAQRWVGKMTCMQSATPEMPYYIAYGPASMRATHNGYGPIATVAHTDGDVRLAFYPAKQGAFPHVADIELLSVMRNNPNGSGLIFETKDVSNPKTPLSITVKGPADIYGVLLDKKTGVSMDNIPMRGSSGTIFTRINTNTLIPFFKHENVGLIILQYGGNSVPAMKNEKSLHTYCREILKQIDVFKRLAPKAKIVFIGPSDMSTAIGGARITYPLLPRFTELLDEYITANGCAFWNMYEAMGGKGSMARWVRAQPQLASEDHIHFTRRGAEHIGRLLCKTLETHYNYYKFRQGDNDYDLPTTDYETLGTSLGETHADQPVPARGDVRSQSNLHEPADVTVTDTASTKSDSIESNGDDAAPRHDNDSTDSADEQQHVDIHPSDSTAAAD